MDKVKHDLDEALQEDSVAVLNVPSGDRRRDLSDVLGTGSKAAGFYSDALPKLVHLKFVSFFTVLIGVKLIYVVGAHDSQMI